MKKDVQVGVILGIIILAIIGVFLSTRTTVKEPVIYIPVTEDKQASILDIDDLPLDSPGDTSGAFVDVTSAPRDARQRKAAVADATKNEMKDIVIEGNWQKAKDEEIIQDNWRAIYSEDVRMPATRFQIHKVQPGEDLSKIARRYYGDVSKWSTIYNANRDKIQDHNFLRVGTELVIPGIDIQEEKKVSQQPRLETTPPSLSQVVEVESAKPAGRIHVVQQGDSIYKLAVKYYNDGTKWNKILEANKKVIKDPKSIRIGQELIIPEL
ncbi:MAG: LysM peptidoglycan-binding domain-containing protein [Candidatus Loosdrechtia sp.]|uniref:LysM peptidoglycan-binding domain-containing protein n=1 Tax=Candidatus Loosdrechtia sp. TaxID=3101272 RepID=UPI003A6277ED|nr:MAG: LysM peptidoglycan-binding domain-containing protein [Candidatus Jettenia sp. AMX2]